MRAILVAAMLSCGGVAAAVQQQEVACTNPAHMDGEITVSVLNDPGGREAAWILGLSASGYFDGLAGYGLHPHLTIVPSGGQIVVNVDSHFYCGGPMVGGCHAWNCSSALVYVWGVDTFLLSHELIETIFHPNVEADGEEIADECNTWANLRQLPVNGKSVLVASYMDASGNCWRPPLI